MGCFQRWSEEAFGAGHVEVSLIDGGHLDYGREAVQDFEDFAREFAVALGVAFDEDGLRAALVSGAQRHGRVDAIFAGLVGGGRHNATFVGLTADDNGLAFQRRVIEFFDRDEEGIHVEVEDGTHHLDLSGFTSL